MNFTNLMTTLFLRNSHKVFHNFEYERSTDPLKCHISTMVLSIIMDVSMPQLIEAVSTMNPTLTDSRHGFHFIVGLSLVTRLEDLRIYLPLREVPPRAYVISNGLDQKTVVQDPSIPVRMPPPPVRHVREGGVMRDRQRDNDLIEHWLGQM
jgi:hypothetical protein